MALNYYVPARMPSAELTQNHAADAPTESAPRKPADQRERVLVAHESDNAVCCLPLACPSWPILGRAALLATLYDHLLGAPVARLVLDGPPGIGKTRIALEIAYDQQIRQHFSGGILMMGPGATPRR